MTIPARIRCICVAIFFLLVLLTTAAAQAQQTINVPAAEPTIQAAINAANNGDTVLVAPGTYVEKINFEGKAVTVTSSGGPSVTTIDGGANGSVVTFSTGETLSSVLSGFTIRNGLQDGLPGGGIYILGASPTIAGNVITGNHAAVGCGIYVSDGSPLIQNNTITANNQAGAGDGGEGGGGILVAGSPSIPAAPQIVGNTITNNSVGGGGNGGGISVWYYSSPLIQDNLIQGNTAYDLGGGVALESYNSPVLIQNMIVGNSSLGGGSGGGLYVFPSSSAQQTFVINNTIAANSAFDDTSGIYVSGFGQSVTFTNNIVTAAPNQTAITCSSLYSSVSPAFSYNDAFAASGTAIAGICDVTTNPGNISADPLFLSASNSDFHLGASSPAVNAGSNSAPNLPSTDFDGNPRISAGTVDLGAYEVVPTSAANISPSNLSFAPLAMGSISVPQPATVSSTGSTGFQISSVQLTGPFAATTTCPTLGGPGGFTGVAGGSSCVYNVTFDPAPGSLAGPVTGTLTVNGTNGASLVVSLSGVALGPNPTASLSATSLSFTPQTVGTTSSIQALTLTNFGSPSLAINSIVASQQYSEANNCPSALVGGASCTILVSFAPSTSGAVSGTLTLRDNAAGSPQSVSLNGTGIDFTIAASPSSASVSSGGSAKFTVSVNTVGGTLSQPVSLSCSGLPAGASCSFNPSSIATSGSSALTITTAESTPLGSSTITMTGSSGSHTHTATVTLTVAPAGPSGNPISIDFVGGNVAMAASETAGVVAAINWNDAKGASNSSGMALVDSTGAATGATVKWTSDDVWEEPITDAPGNVRMMKGYLDNGYADTTTVTVSGLPPNAGGYGVYVYAQGQSDGTNTNTGIYQISGTGVTASSVSLTYNSNFSGTFTQANNSAGNYIFFTIPNVSGFTLSAIPSTASNGYKRAPVNGMQIVPLGPPNPDFTISASPATATVAPGGNVTYSVTVGSLSGFSDAVGLSVSGLPTGATYSFNPSSITAAGTSVLTITAGASTPNGTSTLTVTGTDQSTLATHTTNVSLVVATPDFTITASPSTRSVAPGNNTSYTVTIGALSGFSDSVTLSATGLPSGASYSFSPASITGSGTATLTINTTSGTPIGSSTLTVTATDPTTSTAHSTTVGFTVQTSAFSGDAISIDFVGQDVPMGNAEVAGVVARSNWNNAIGASNSLPLALVDAIGAATTASVTWSADNVWEEPITDAAGSVRMMKGYLDNGYEDTTTINVTGLPSDPNGYTVLVYADGAPGTGSNTGLYRISGAGITTTTISLTYNSNFNGIFTQANGSVGNYVVFTIPSVTGFTISAIPSTSSSGYERAAVNGIQIVGN